MQPGRRLALRCCRRPIRHWQLRVATGRKGRTRDSRWGPARSHWRGCPPPRGRGAAVPAGLPACRLARRCAAIRHPASQECATGVTHSKAKPMTTEETPAKFDRELLNELARGAQKVFENAEALFFEAKILSAAGALKRSPSAAAWPFLANSPARRILSRHCAQAHESLQMLYYRHTHRP